MKVRELQERLSKLNPDLDLVCYSEDEKLLKEGQGFILFDILAIETAEVERLRLDNRTPYLKFVKGPASTTIATLQVTSDF